MLQPAIQISLCTILAVILSEKTTAGGVIPGPDTPIFINLTEKSQIVELGCTPSVIGVQSKIPLQIVNSTAIDYENLLWTKSCSCVAGSDDLPDEFTADNGFRATVIYVPTDKSYAKTITLLGIPRGSSKAEPIVELRISCEGLEIVKAKPLSFKPDKSPQQIEITTGDSSIEIIPSGLQFSTPGIKLANINKTDTGYCAEVTFDDRLGGQRTFLSRLRVPVVRVRESDGQRFDGAETITISVLGDDVVRIHPKLVRTKNKSDGSTSLVMVMTDKRKLETKPKMRATLAGWEIPADYIILSKTVQAKGYWQLDVKIPSDAKKPDFTVGEKIELEFEIYGENGESISTESVTVIPN
jgi:hypothetical protein